MSNKSGCGFTPKQQMGAAVTEVEGDAAVFVLPGRYAYQVREQFESRSQIITVTFQTREELQAFMDQIMEDKDRDSARPGESNNPKHARSTTYPSREH